MSCYVNTGMPLQDDDDDDQPRGHLKAYHAFAQASHTQQVLPRALIVN